MRYLKMTNAPNSQTNHLKWPSFLMLLTFLGLNLTKSFFVAFKVTLYNGVML